MIVLLSNRRWMPAMLFAACCVCLLSSGCSWKSRSLNGQGVALFQQGNLDGAQVAFQQALSHDPNNPHIYYNIARVYHHKALQADDPTLAADAETYYHLCLDREGDHRESYRSLAVLLMETDRADKAFTLMERWAVRSPHLADPKVEIARLYEEHQDLGTAEEKLLEAIALEYNNPRALAALGGIREKRGDYIQALANYQRSLQFDPQQPNVAARVAMLQGYARQSGSRLATPSAPTPVYPRR